MIPLNICFSQNMRAKIQGLGQDVRVAFESIENYIKAQDEKMEQLYKENVELKANSIIQDNIIQDNHNPIDQDKIIKLILENKELKSRLEKSVELPCKVGDILYKKDYLGDKIRKYKVIAISIFNSISVKNKIEVTAHNYRGASVPINVEYLIKNFGKTVFLTKEEAEQALKGGNENA